MALASSLVSMPSAEASTYLVNFSGLGGNTGKLWVDLNGTVATSVSGSINGYTVTGLSSYAGADQQLFVTGPVHFTVPGLSFSARNGTLYNLTAYPFNTDAITDSVRDPNGWGTPTPFAMTNVAISAVPLPAPLAMILLGLGALLVARRGFGGNASRNVAV